MNYSISIKQRTSEEVPDTQILVAEVESNWNLILEELNRWIGLSRGVSGVKYSTAEG